MACAGLRGPCIQLVLSECVQPIARMRHLTSFRALFSGEEDALPSGRSSHPALIPAARMTFSHFASSEAICAEHSSGELPTG